MGLRSPRARIPAGRTWVVTGSRYRDETLRELPDLLPAQLLEEPCGRNTAPAVALGALGALTIGALRGRRR